eukprot:294298-Pleurochrysis_carterae.AAC.1
MPVNSSLNQSSSPAPPRHGVRQRVATTTRAHPPDPRSFLLGTPAQLECGIGFAFCNLSDY